MTERDEMETYAAIAADLARGRDRAEVLAEHGLDEQTFDRLEDRAYAAMSAADDSQGVPEAVMRFDTALRAAVDKHAADAPSLEDFVRALRIVQEGGKVHERLAEQGLSVGLLLQGSAHYAPRFTSEPELAMRFQELMSRGGPKR